MKKLKKIIGFFQNAFRAKKLKKFRGFFREIFHRNRHQFFPDPKMRLGFQLIFGVLDIILGIFLIFLGILGFFLPILPGFLLFVIGVLLVSPHHGRQMIAFLKIIFYKTRALFRKFRSRK